MTVLARRVASVPARSAVDTWSVIVDLIAPDPSSSARSDLAAAAGVAHTVIASEVSDAFVVFGSGPRTRVYCVYGDDALMDDDVNENPLSHGATEGNWHLSIPCPSEDLEWIQRRLASCRRISAREEGEAVGDERNGEQDSRHQGFTVDESTFFRS